MGQPKISSIHPRTHLSPELLPHFLDSYLISQFLKMGSKTGINRPSMFASHIVVDNSIIPPVTIARPFPLFSPPHAPPLRKLNANSLTCCRASPPNVINHGYDLYDLLGVDRSPIGRSRSDATMTSPATLATTWPSFSTRPIPSSPTHLPGPSTTRMVERSKLAALKFLMAKQPRGNVRVGASNSVGTRVSKIFVDANKFESRFLELKDKAKQASEADLEREARMSAIQAIRKLTNWWYWQPPTSSSHGNGNAIWPSYTRNQRGQVWRSFTKQQRSAVKRQLLTTLLSSLQQKQNTLTTIGPPNTILPITTQKPNFHPTSSTSDSTPKTHKTELKGRIRTENIGEDEWPNPFNSNIPIVIASFAACVVGLQGGGQTSRGLKEHIVGNLVLEVVNCPLMQIFLTCVTWYSVGVALEGFVYAAVNKKADAGNSSSSLLAVYFRFFTSKIYLNLM